MLVILLAALSAFLITISIFRLLVFRRRDVSFLLPEGMKGRTAREMQLRKEANFVGIGLAVFVALVTFVIWRFVPLSLVLGMVIGIFAPTLYRSHQTKKVIDEIDLQLPSTLQLIANSFKSGRNLLDCMGDAAQYAPPPINAEFAQIVREANAGGLKAALDEAWDRIPMRNFRTTIMVFKIVLNRGGRLGETASELADTFREAHKVEAMSKTATQQTRATMVMISIAPVAIIIMLMFGQPEAIDQLLGTTRGWIVTGIAISLYLTSLAMMRRLTNIQI